MTEYERLAREVAAERARVRDRTLEIRRRRRAAQQRDRERADYLHGWGILKEGRP